MRRPVRSLLRLARRAVARALRRPGDIDPLYAQGMYEHLLLARQSLVVTLGVAVALAWARFLMA